MKLFQDILII